MKLLKCALITTLMACSALPYSALANTAAQERNQLENYSLTLMPGGTFGEFRYLLDRTCPRGQYKTGYQLCECLESSTSIQTHLGDYFAPLRNKCEQVAK